MSRKETNFLLQRPPRATPARFLASLLRLAGIILLLILVVAKIQQIAPYTKPAGWLFLGTGFVVLVLTASWFSTRIARRARITEERAEWLAVILLGTLVALLLYFGRGLFWYFLQ